MNLIALPAFTDNYIWMLHDGRQAIVVDPGDSAPVLQALTAMNLRLAGILVTHYHADHVSGINHLRERLEDQAHVYGPATEAIPGHRIPITGNQTLDIAGLRFDTLSVPGHTAGHVAYYHAPLQGSPLVFCGDTLFSGGCGRLEGTPAQMLNSLERLAALPPTTQVCCAHEYTLDNMKFARIVEPSNEDVLQHTLWCEVQRQRGRPTLPSTIATERQVNPFLRCNQPHVVQSAQARAGLPLDDDLAVFTVLRQWKNDFQ